jgi:hypothetical protein
MNSKYYIEFESYIIIFNEVNKTDLLEPYIYDFNSGKSIPLLVEEYHIDIVRQMLMKLTDRNIPFNLFYNIVAGACSYAMKRGM